METKTCGHCRFVKPISQFNKKYGKPQSWCKICNSERSRKYYAENREKHLQVITLRKQRQVRRTKKYISMWKLSRGCAVCGYNTCASALDAHHKSDKLFELAKARYTSLAKIKQELEKCTILCATHHRELHAGVCPEIGRLEGPFKPTAKARVGSNPTTLIR